MKYILFNLRIFLLLNLELGINISQKIKLLKRKKLVNEPEDFIKDFERSHFGIKNIRKAKEIYVN